MTPEQAFALRDTFEPSLDCSLAGQTAREDVANACQILLDDVRGARKSDWDAIERVIQLLRSALTKTAR